MRVKTIIKIKMADILRPELQSRLLKKQLNQSEGRTCPHSHQQTAPRPTATPKLPKQVILTIKAAIQITINKRQNSTEILQETTKSK